jgi:serine/threonine protein kinase
MNTAAAGIALVIVAYCLLQGLALWLVLRAEYVERLLLAILPKSSGVRDLLAKWRSGMHLGAPPLSGRIVSLPLAAEAYRFEDLIGAGDISDVYHAVRGGQDYVIKVGRAGDSTPLLLAEQEVLRSLQRAAAGEAYGDYLPLPSDWFVSGEAACSVFAMRRGFVAADRIRQRHWQGVDGRHIAWMWNRILEVLGFVHREGWIHGAVLPTHVLFHPDNHGLQLIDWTQAGPAFQPLQFAPRRFKDWYPPECHRRRPATPASDIYLAAQTMIWLAGGDPLTGFIPAHIPGQLAQLLLRCRAHASGARPRDAWALHAELRDLLRDLYGSPRFVHLHFS